MNRSVLHIDLDTFFVSCSRLQNPELNGLPVIVGGSKERGVVASCSYEARVFGVRSAMPMYLALQRCPHAKVVKGDMDLYSRKSHEITQVIEEAAPVMEKASIDEFYLDATGLDKFFGTWKWANELAAKVTKESGLPISLGLSVNKTVAKIATGEGKPRGRKEVVPQEVQPFLNPLSIQKIPMIGSVTYRTLSRIGVRKIHTLAEMPQEYLYSLFGQNGTAIWKKANGIDHAPVERYSEQKSMSKETTFDKDSMNIPQMHALIATMVEELCYELRKGGRLTSTIEVKIRYNNFDTVSKQKRISYTSCDHTIRAVARELFEILYDRRMMLRLVGVKFSGLVSGRYQIDLFEDTQEMVSLYQAVDRMKNRFGTGAVFRGNTLKSRR